MLDAGCWMLDDRGRTNIQYPETSIQYLVVLGDPGEL